MPLFQIDVVIYIQDISIKREKIYIYTRSEMFLKGFSLVLHNVKFTFYSLICYGLPKALGSY